MSVGISSLRTQFLDRHPELGQEQEVEKLEKVTNPDSLVHRYVASPREKKPAILDRFVEVVAGVADLQSLGELFRHSPPAFQLVILTRFNKILDEEITELKLLEELLDHYNFPEAFRLAILAHYLEIVSKITDFDLIEETYARISKGGLMISALPETFLLALR